MASKEYRVRFPAEAAKAIDTAAYERGVKPIDLIRERYRRGLAGVTIALPPDNIDDRAEQRTVAPLVPEAFTHLCRERLDQIQVAVMPLGETLAPLQDHERRLQAVLSQAEFFQMATGGIIALIEVMALDPVVAERGTERQNFIEAVTAPVFPKAQSQSLKEQQ